MKKPWVLSYPLSAQWRLIRLGRCLGWSESSLGAHSLCWFCHVAAHICSIWSYWYDFNWACTWQNQQNDMRAWWRPGSAWASAQSDQSLLSALRNLGSFASHWRNLGPLLPTECTVKTHQTGRLPGWSESSLGAHVILLVLSCAGPIAWW